VLAAIAMGRWPGTKPAQEQPRRRF